MLPFSFTQKVRERLAPHLRLIERDVLDISRRIREEVDETLFVCWNTLYDRFEVHSLDHFPTTYAWTVPFNRLDERTIKRARRNNIRMRGQEIFREVDEANEKLERSLARKAANDFESAAKEIRSQFAKLGWELSRYR